MCVGLRQLWHRGHNFRHTAVSARSVAPTSSVCGTVCMSACGEEDVCVMCAMCVCEEVVCPVCDRVVHVCACMPMMVPWA